MKFYKCRACGRLSYPAHFICRVCRGPESDEVEIENGRLITYTAIAVPPPGIEKPLRIGIVEFEGGVRALGQLAEEMEVGTEVKAKWRVVRKDDAGDRWGYTFQRA